MTTAAPAFPELDALRADVVQNRHDLGPRLVYADWLDDHAGLLEGRKEDWLARAEFVRLQCRLEEMCPGAGTLPVPPSVYLRDRRPAEWFVRCGDLLARHRNTWLDDEFRRAGVKDHFYYGALSGFGDDYLVLQDEGVEKGARVVLKWKWRGGFLDHLTCSWALWDAVGDRLYAAWPVTRVEIEGGVPLIVSNHRPEERRTEYRIGDRPYAYFEGLYPTSALHQRVTTGELRHRLFARYWPGVEFTLLGDVGEIRQSAGV